MNPTQRIQLIKLRSVARGMLSRIQNFIEAGDQKLNDIQVRCNKLPGIFNRYDIAQSELELSDDTDHTGDRELFESQYYQVEAKFSEFLHPVMDPPSRCSSQGAACQVTEITLFCHIQVAHTLSYQPLHCQLSKVTHIAGYISDTHLRH